MEKIHDSDLELEVVEVNSEREKPCSEKPEIPDGGWGWVICCGTFIVNFIVFGIHNSFGVVYANLLDELKMGKAETGEYIVLLFY
jgi:hypothetical protein